MYISKKNKELIGGIESTPEKREKNQQMIKEAIRKNNLGEEPTIIEDEIFAELYPEGLKYINDYYQSLYNSQVANIKVWDGKKYINKIEKIKELKKEITDQKIKTLVIYGAELINMPLEEIKAKFGLTLNQITMIFNAYKKVLNDVKTVKGLGDNNQKYNIAEQIYEDIVINGEKKVEVCKKYKISNESLDGYIELLKEKDIKKYEELKNKLKLNSNKSYHQLKKIVLMIAKYCKEKIHIDNDEISMPFTMLDYYCITDYSPDKLCEFLENHNNFNPNDKEEMISRKIVYNMLSADKNIGGYITKEKFVSSNIAGGTIDNIIRINDVICEDIFTKFEHANIPKNKKLLEIAFYRYVQNKPMLPLMLKEKIMIDDSEEQIENKSKR